MTGLHFRPPSIPASFFGVVLGLAGLGAAWRTAHQVWNLPAVVGEIVMLAAAIVWAVVLVLYIAKRIALRSEAYAELHHPVQCCFIGLAGVATMLIANAALPYWRLGAECLYLLGAAFTLAFALCALSDEPADRAPPNARHPACAAGGRRGRLCQRLQRRA